MPVGPLYVVGVRVFGVLWGWMWVAGCGLWLVVGYVLCSATEGVMAGRPRKPADFRVDSRTERKSSAHDGRYEALSAPEPSDSWPEPVVRWWEAFWESNLAAQLAEVDVDTVFRLADLKAAYLELYGEFQAAPIVEGSKGQRVVNPAVRVALQVLPEIRQLEAVLGVGTKARQNLGLENEDRKRDVADLIVLAGEDKEEGAE